MTKKNWGLLLILFFLTGVMGILLSRNGASGKLEVEQGLFAIEDTAAIVRIELLQQSGAGRQELKRSGKDWVLNDQYKADPAIMKLLLSVLHNVEVRRPVSGNQKKEINQLLEEEGTQVRLYSQAGLQKEFFAGGRESGAMSFFMQGGQAYVVELPGYASYVSGIFQLSTNNLRDRTVFESNYLNLRQVQVSYPDGEDDVLVRFDGRELKVEGVAQPDSAQLLGFLSLFEHLQAVGYINPKEYPELDSLLQQTAVANISVANINDPEGKVLQLYSTTPDKRYRLAWLPAEQQALLLDERLAKMLLIKKISWKQKKSS